MKIEMGLVAVVAAGMLIGTPLAAQPAVSADGLVESTSGGFKFPDGSIQTTAATVMTGWAPVEDTGQQGCWDQDGNPVSCSGTGQDGDLQAGVDWPVPRFTDNGDGTVTDNMTNLVWLKDARCLGETHHWQEALDWVDDLNTTPVACADYTPMTFTDWRMPNIKELTSLVSYGQYDPALPLGHPFVNVEGYEYWSSTTFVWDPAKAWVVPMLKGLVKYQLKTTPGGMHPVWPVRGGQ